MKRKVHGLWRFHRGIKQVQRTYETARNLRWWVDEERFLLLDRYDTLFGTYWYRYAGYTHADAIVRCARRYIRMFAPQIRRVAEWNDLVLRIANRAEFTHHATINAVLIKHSLPRSLVRWFNDSDDTQRPWAYIEDQVRRRYERIKEARQKRIDSTCRVCGTTDKVKIIHMGWTPTGRKYLFEDLREYWSTSFALCEKHRRHYRQLEKRAISEETARLEVQRTQRKIREASKVNA